MKEELVIFLLQEAKGSLALTHVGGRISPVNQTHAAGTPASKLLPGGMALKIAFLSFLRNDSLETGD